MGKKTDQMKKVSLGTHVDLPSIFWHPDSIQKYLNKKMFAPLYVEISPTSACNHKCFFCYTENVMSKYGGISIPPKRLINLLIELAECGVKNVELQGTGEPLLNKGTPEAIVQGKKRGMDICLVSNFSLPNQKTIDKIVECISFLRISSLEKNHKLYEKTHGPFVNRSPEDEYKKVIKNIEYSINLKERNNLDTVFVSTFIATKYNIRHIVETAKLAKELGFNIFTIKPLIRMSQNDGHENLDINLHTQYADIFSEVENISDETFKVNCRNDFFEYYVDSSKVERNFTSCPGIYFEVLIDSDAKIYPCGEFWRNEEFCLGDLSNDTFKNVWFNKKRVKATNEFIRKNRYPVCDYRCKQFPINGILEKLSNPRLHPNVI
jgi:radical SAM protein with 4Fe4S-binding SPASM domain|tara:strand:- start:2822 stop:3955 length:1134 start_codon:yes stop_codon:yes gene_type:complete